LGGAAIVSSILVYFLFQVMTERDIQATLKRDEMRTAKNSMSRELVIRQNRLRMLQSKLSQTRYQLTVK
jgi:hypothetical protein